MRPESLYFLFSPVTRIKGVGGQTAKALSNLLPQATVVSGATLPIVRDLLFHLPVGIVDRRFTCALRECPNDVVATFVVNVDQHLPPKQKRFGKQPYKVLCSNDTGDITLVFFGANTDYLKQSLPEGQKRVISGRVEHFDFRLQMTHPDIIAPVSQLAEVQKAEAVYPLTAGLTSRRIAKIVADALEKLPELPEWIDNIPLPLREGIKGWGTAHGYAEGAINRAKQLRNDATETERKLWQYLKQSELDHFKFRRQQPIGPYIVDFFCPAAKLIIELDGAQHATQQVYDHDRTKFLEAQGYRVLRFWNNEVSENLEGVYQRISDVLRESPPPSPLPQGEGEKIVSWKSALLAAHHPATAEDLQPTTPARMRLAYDEMLAGQLHLAMLRRHMQHQSGDVITGTKQLTDALIAALPYQLTKGQQQVLVEILSDMASGRRMTRLLQGDVGSGKTIVALLAMLSAVEQGLQAALMVPTELIAQQHFENVVALLRATCHVPRVTLLTGSVKGAARKEALEKIASGEAKIIIGTHALFQDAVEFKNLALTVIDEQHRFGVAQRMALTQKGNAPHILHMTATPIPRSLSMVLYGDMDVSLLTEKPANRQPITTRLIANSRYEEVVARLKTALDRGEKAYWICPLIEDSGFGIQDSGDSDIAAANSRFSEFKARFGNVVSLVHGRMKKDERDEAMHKFASGETKLLVATTVVEVGVDVKDATIIVIEQAERFGLAQLHQLRGRVGRGEKQSACVLLYSEDTGFGIQDSGSAQTFERLSILRETEDGFKIAEADLAQRGGGDLLGVRQSGLPRFIFTDLFEHQELLKKAREDAANFLNHDPDFTSERGKALKVLLELFGYET